MTGCLCPSPSCTHALQRLATLSAQLVDIAASLSHANASMLLESAGSGASLAFPVLPASLYEHSIAARPNFDRR